MVERLPFSETDVLLNGLTFPFWLWDEKDHFIIQFKVWHKTVQAKEKSACNAALIFDRRSGLNKSNLTLYRRTEWGWLPIDCTRFNETFRLLDSLAARKLLTSRVETWSSKFSLPATILPRFNIAQTIHLNHLLPSKVFAAMSLYVCNIRVETLNAWKFTYSM